MSLVLSVSDVIAALTGHLAMILVAIVVGGVALLLQYAATRRGVRLGRQLTWSSRRRRRLVQVGSLLSVLLLVGTSLPVLAPVALVAAVIVAVVGLSLPSARRPQLSGRPCQRIPAVVAAIGMTLALALGSLLWSAPTLTPPIALASGPSLSHTAPPERGNGPSQGTHLQHSTGISPADANGGLAQSHTFTVNGGYTTAGVGMRNRGYGTITLAGVPSGSQVQAAYLYWDILADAEDSSFSQGQFTSQAITGTLIGSAADPCWGGRGELCLSR